MFQITLPELRVGTCDFVWIRRKLILLTVQVTNNK